MKVFIFLAIVLDVIGVPFSDGLTRLLYDLPNSRKQEFEGALSYPVIPFVDTEQSTIS